MARQGKETRDEDRTGKETRGQKVSLLYKPYSSQKIKGENGNKKGEERRRDEDRTQDRRGDKRTAEEKGNRKGEERKKVAGRRAS